MNQNSPTNFAQAGGPVGGAPLSQVFRVPLVLDIWRIAMRHRILIGACLFSGLLLGLAVALLSTPIYRASVQIVADPSRDPSLQMEKMGQTFQQDGIFIETQLGLLRSHSLADRVVRKMGLANDPKYASANLSRDQRLLAARNKLVSGIAATQIPGSRIIAITYQDPDRQKAAQIANSYADNYIQSNLDRSLDKTAFARDYMKTRLDAIRVKLEDSEQQLVDYARAKGLITITTSDGKGASTSTSMNNAILSNLTNAIADSERKRIETQQKMEQAQRIGTTQSDAARTQEGELAQLQAQYAEQRQIFKPDYPDMVRLEQKINSLKASQGRADSKTNNNAAKTAAGEFYAAAGEERALKQRMVELKTNVLNEREQSVQYTILQRDVDTNRALYDGLLQRYKEVGVSGGVGENQVAIIDRADVPTSPISPRIPLDILAGLLAGLGLGFLSAFALDLINNNISNPSDIESKLGIKSIGAIPDVGSDTSVSAELDDPKSPVTEAYMTVSNMLRLATENGVPKILLLTSTLPGEGKSSSAFGLARSFAKSGKRVLLVDADLRRPTFAVDGNKRTGGFTNVLTGDIPASDVIKMTSPNLWLLPAGDIPPNPSELFSGTKLEPLIRDLATKFDIVVLDCAPVLGFVDAPMLATIADGTIMVFEAGRVRTPMAQSSLRSLQNVGAYIVGGLVTKFTDKHDEYGASYGYSYNYDYAKHAKDQVSGPARTISASSLGKSD